MKNRILNISFKIAIFILSFLGITIFCGIYDNDIDLSVMCYYTMITNFLCMLYFGIDIVYLVIKNKTFCPKLKSIVTMGITITGFIFWTLLANKDFEMAEIHVVGNLFLHYLVPILTILDWLIFDKKGKYSKYSPINWSILPLCYFIFVILVVFLGYSFSDNCRYPYYFLDFDNNLSETLRYSGLIFGYILGLGYLYVILDSKLGKRKKIK